MLWHSPEAHMPSRTTKNAGGQTSTASPPWTVNEDELVNRHK